MLPILLQALAATYGVDAGHPASVPNALAPLDQTPQPEPSKAEAIGSINVGKGRVYSRYHILSIVKSWLRQGVKTHVSQL